MSDTASGWWWWDTVDSARHEQPRVLTGSDVNWQTVDLRHRRSRSGDCRHERAGGSVLDTIVTMHGPRPDLHQEVKSPSQLGMSIVNNKSRKSSEKNIYDIKSYDVDSYCNIQPFCVGHNFTASFILGSSQKA